MIKKFTGIDGRVAWALTHVDAVVGLKKALRDISSSIVGTLEDGSNVSIEDMEIGKSYLKDGKIYFKTTDDIESSSNVAVPVAVGLGGDGITLGYYDRTLDPSYSEASPISWNDLVTSISTIPKIVALSEADYNALTPPRQDTIYLITEST